MGALPSSTPPDLGQQTGDGKPSPYKKIIPKTGRSENAATNKKGDDLRRPP